MGPAHTRRAPCCAVLLCAEKVKGTEWSEVVCDDGKRYYYNDKSGETSWQVPPEVEAKQKVKVRGARGAGVPEGVSTGGGMDAAHGRGQRWSQQGCTARPVPSLRPGQLRMCA